MTALSIPTIDALDAAWFTSALRAGGQLSGDRRVISVTPTQIGEGAGLMSLVWRVTLGYDQPSDAPVSAFLDGFVAKVPQILDGIMGPDTLIHNDYRVDNLLWDGDEVVVLDFQLSAIASGLLDFAFFVAQSIPKEVRQERFDDLLDAYVGELSANGIELDRDTAIDKYRRALVFGFLWPLGLMGGYDTLDPRGRELAHTMLDRHLSAVRDTDALALYP